MYIAFLLSTVLHYFYFVSFAFKSKFINYRLHKFIFCFTIYRDRVSFFPVKYSFKSINKGNLFFLLMYGKHFWFNFIIIKCNNVSVEYFFIIWGSFKLTKNRYANSFFFCGLIRDVILQRYNSAWESLKNNI